MINFLSDKICKKEIIVLGKSPRTVGKLKGSWGICLSYNVKVGPDFDYIAYIGYKEIGRISTFSTSGFSIR